MHKWKDQHGSFIKKLSEMLATALGSQECADNYSNCLGTEGEKTLSYAKSQICKHISEFKVPKMQEQSL